MLERIINWSLENRIAVITIFIAALISGVIALEKLPIDAFPDTTPVQVQINTVIPELSPLEVELQVTSLVEQAIAGLVGLKDVRSISKFGLSQVTVVFDDGTDIYFARQLVMEKLQTVEMPANLSPPEMGPVTTGLGEVYHYIVYGKGRTLEELTTLHDWGIKPRLRSLPGVAEVNTWGGHHRQYHIVVDLNRLMKYDFTLDDLFLSLGRNNMNVGGGSITSAGEMHLIHGIGLAKDIQEIGGIVIDSFNGVPVRIRDIAEVRLDHEIRRGATTANAEGEVVLGLCFMLMGENSHLVTDRIKKRMNEIKGSLPPGVEVRTVYDRTALVDQVIGTVKKNLFEGALLVIAVLFVFLGNLRAGLIVAAAIPLSMVFAFNGMLRAGIAGSLMSLGAIDFGLIVDSSVIMVENSLRHLERDKGRRAVRDIIREASLEVRRPTMYGELIIMVVYLPILTLQGIEGKLFRPMALTVIFALAGSLLISVTLMPVLASLFLQHRPSRRENVFVGLITSCYRPVLRQALRLRTWFITGALVLVAGGLLLATRVGSEFIPRLSEMGIVINTVRLAGVSLEESVRYGTQFEKIILKKFPDEVQNVWTRTGTAEVATDPMGIELSDIFISLTPRRQWKRADTQEELTDLLRRELKGMPGTRMIFTQPIEMRVNEMIAGIRTDLGIKLFGDDLEILKKKAAEVQTIVSAIAGCVDIYTEQIIGQPVLEIEIDQKAASRYGVPARHILEIVESIGTKRVGDVRQGQRRFDLVVRLAEKYRQDPGAVGRILVPAEGGRRIPLSGLAEIRQVEGPTTITREWQKRRIVVQCNVKGRDIGSFVQEVRKRLERDLELPTGYFIDYGGQFEHLDRARKRLMIVVPMALIMILLLLYASTRSIRDTLLIFTGAPFAMIGGVLMLWLRDMPFTISAAVGFVAVSGVAMLNGLVMVSTIRRLIRQGTSLLEAVEQSALMRLRPILMTALVAGLGFVPMALNTGVGAEVQRPLATVVIGGVISDNLLTLLILPALYAAFGEKRGRRHDL